MLVRHYSKSALSVEEQLKRLADQGLIVDDLCLAAEILSTVSFYRFSGYLLPFKNNHTLQSRRSFENGTTFDRVWQLYQFDRELRLLVLDAIEKIEVAFRTSLVNVTSTQINPFWYADRNHHRNFNYFNSILKNVNAVIREKQEPFLRHYYENYDTPPYPPIWMMAETISFGQCTKLFTNIKTKAVKTQISAIFKQSPTVMDSWMLSLSYIRNICAHHARLWNRWIVNQPLIPKNDPLMGGAYEKERKFYKVAYVIQKLLITIVPKTHWKNNLFELFKKYEHCVDFQAMGFAASWENDSFWKR